MAEQTSKRKLLNLAMSSALVLLELPAAQALAEENTSARQIDEVVVTARRREEVAQDTPLTLSVFDANAIERAGIKEITDLNAVVPGVNLISAGTPINSVFSIRGVSRATSGSVQPAVSTYVNDVPLTIWGASIPTYDMANLQVLKGPQGTLFGRNSTTGAVLATTQAPSHEFGGYVSTMFGNYNASLYEVGVDIPVVKDVIALRLAGQIDQRDGYTKDMVFGDDLSNKDRENFRISLLVEPSENLSNLFVYDQTNDNSEEVGNVPLRAGPGLVDLLPFTNGSFLDGAGTIPCNGNPVCDFDAFMDRQESAGVRRIWPSVNQSINFERTLITNTTTWNIGNITLKNIIGQQEINFSRVSDVDGTQMRLIEAKTDVGLEQFSNEFQILGDTLGGDLEYIIGYFYLDNEPEGRNKLSLQLFNPSDVPFETAALGSETHNFETSRAYFVQASFQLSHLNDALSAFSIDAGYRSTDDEVTLCTTRSTPLDVYLGKGVACSGVIPDVSKVSEEFSKETYLLGLNYRHSDDLLLYALLRTGYRAGGLNAPKFGGELLPFQSFEPEDTLEIELGMKWDWAFDNVVGRLNMALFESSIENVQGPFSTAGTADPDNDGDPSNNPNSTNVFTNPGEASVKGVEMELVVQPTENLQLTLVGTYLDKQLDKLTLTPDQLPSNLSPAAASPEVIEQTIFLASPDYSYSVGASYRLPLDRQLGDIEISARYHAMSDLTQAALEAPGYELVDARLDWSRVMGSSFDAAIFVKNATDEEALVSSSSSGGGLGYFSGTYTAPRMYGVSLKYSF